MPFANLGFELVGATFGSANSWTVSFVSTAYDFFDFSNGNTPSPTVQSLTVEEGFEGGWQGATPYLYAFQPLDVSEYDFSSDDALPNDPDDPDKNHENFEDSWGVDGYGYVLGSNDKKLFDGGLNEFDAFDDWYASPPLIFTPRPDETFEVGTWSNFLVGTETYTLKLFDGPSVVQVEDFEQVDNVSDPETVDKTVYWAADAYLFDFPY